jgi:hypothetical protein
MPNTEGGITYPKPSTVGNFNRHEYEKYFEKKSASNLKYYRNLEQNSTNGIGEIDGKSKKS